MSARRLPTLPANRRALRSSLYAHTLPSHTRRPLAHTPLTDLTGEIMALRAGGSKVSELLFLSKEMDPKEVIELVRVLAYVIAVLGSTAERQERMNHPGDAMSEAFEQAVAQMDFFDLVEGGK